MTAAPTALRRLAPARATSADLGPEPLALPGLVAGWPATGTWTPEALARRFGRAAVAVHVANGPAQLRRSVLPLAAALDAIANAAPGRVVAVAGHPVAALGAEAEAEVPLPAVARRLKGAVGFLWVGPAGKRVPPHIDGEGGLLAQVWGRKRLHLIAPEHRDAMAPLPEHPVLSRIRDVTSAPQLAGVPRLVVDLGPGDAVWVPAGWWHQVDYRTTAVSVNFWPASYLDAGGRPTATAGSRR